MSARRLAIFMAVAALGLTITAPASAHGKGKRHSGVKGVVLNTTCYGACAEPPPPSPAYSGPVTITVHRASDGVLVASREISDGNFRIRVKRGRYDVSAVPP